MKSKKALPVILLAFVVLIAGASVLYNRLGQEVKPDQLAAGQPADNESTWTDELYDDAPDTAHTHAEGEKVVHAPDFTVYDKDGNAVKLSDYIGKPIVLNFWASWCGPCQSEMPGFNSKYIELKDDVHFLMINMTDGKRETIESASKFIDENGYAFPVFFDTSGEAALIFGAHSLPTTFFIDAYGHVIAQVVGEIKMDILNEGVSMIYG